MSDTQSSARSWQRLLASDVAAGMLLACWLLSMAAANSEVVGTYRQLWNRSVGGIRSPTGSTTD